MRRTHASDLAYCVYPIEFRPHFRYTASTMRILLSAVAALTFSVCAVRAADSAENWGHLCASCHGKDGVGHTKAGKKLDVKDLTAADYQKTFTDDEAFNALKKGITAKDGTDKMKPFADKLTDDEIKGLVTYVRALAK